MKTANILGALTLFLLGLPAAAQAGARAKREEVATLREMYSLPKTERIASNRTALILVDFQEEFFSGKLRLPNASKAASHAKVLLDWARAEKIAIIHVLNIAKSEHSVVFAPNSPGVKEVAVLKPMDGERILVKSSGGGFTNTDLDDWLKTRNIETIVVAGLMTHLAVYFTACDATVKGYRVVVAADATATRTLPSPTGGLSVDFETVQRAALASLSDRFGEVMKTQKITSLPVIP
jgi:nicotinamidase-related amidase